MKQIYCVAGTTCNSYPLEPRKIIKKLAGDILSSTVVLVLVIVYAVALFSKYQGPFIDKSTKDVFSVLSNYGLFVLLAGFIFFAGRFLREFLYFRFYFYNIGSDVVVIRKGIISRNEATIPYNKIQNVFVDQDLWDRILGLYDVHMATADYQSAYIGHIDGVSAQSAQVLKNLLLANMKTAKETGV